MRALVQRVRWAEVEVGGRVHAQTRAGLLVYLGVAAGDQPAQAAWLAEKVGGLRIFEDAGGKLNLSVRDVGGEVLAVSNFTLLADARKGRRPEFSTAAPGPAAKPLYEEFLAALAKQGCKVFGGVFGEDMIVRSSADGPVNVIIDSPPPTEPKTPEAMQERSK